MTRVAVVVPTRNREPLLRRLLESLTSAPSRFELIVVDDGSTDATPALLADPPLPLTAIRNERPFGAGAARNAGWRAAAGADLIALTDDDCTVQAGWLEALIAAHRREPGAILQGRTLPDPAQEGRQTAWSRSQRQESLGPNFQTCNIAYPRALLEQHGGFDPDFPHYAEDADLAWRAIEAGATATFVPEALVHHAVHLTGPLDALRDSQRWADAVRAFARHPGMRRDFELGIFWREAHPRLLLALAGLTLVRRTRGLSLTLALPYVVWKRRLHGSYAGVLAKLPAHVAVDAAEVVAMARGSARHGTFVL